MGKIKKYNVWSVKLSRILSTNVQFVQIKRFRHIKYAVAHAQSLRSKAEADDRTFRC